MIFPLANTVMPHFTHALVFSNIINSWLQIISSPTKKHPLRCLNFYIDFFTYFSIIKSNEGFWTNPC